MGIIEDVGRRMGTVMVFAALGAVAGPPISGAINAATGSTKMVSYYAGGILSTLFPSPANFIEIFRKYHSSGSILDADYSVSDTEKTLGKILRGKRFVSSHRHCVD